MELNNDLYFDMEEVRPDTIDSGKMLRDISREKELTQLITMEDWKGISNDREIRKRYKEVFSQKKNFDNYVTLGAKIRYEWSFNWLQKIKGPAYAIMSTFGSNMDNETKRMMMSMRPDWNWNDKEETWSDRYDQERPRKAFWAAFRWKNTDAPIIVMTVQLYYPEMETSYHMYVARTLAGFEQPLLRETALLLPLHSRIARYLKDLADQHEKSYKYIETNPVTRVRDMLHSDTRLNVKNARGLIIITVTPEFLERYKTDTQYNIKCSAIGCSAQALGTCAVCQQQAYCGEECVKKDAYRHKCLVDSQCE